MVGITSYDAYVPLYRLSRKTISSAMGWFNRGGSSGEKAVANYDEDSVSMAVAASMGCIRRMERERIDGVYCGTTSAPFRQRESAGIIATVLDLGSSIRTVDITNSTKSGVSALLLAFESVQAGGMKNALVCASDCLLGKPGGPQEALFGDGAAAFVIGTDHVVASLEGVYCVSYDFPDHWRTFHDKYDRSLEDRWIRDVGYTKFIPEAISGLLKKHKLGAKDIAKVIYPCLYARDHAAIGKGLGFQPPQIQDPLINVVGEAGVASPLMALVAALEESKKGDNILVAGWGNGTHVLWLRVTDEIEKNENKSGIKKQLASKKEMTHYEKYLAYRGIIPMEVGMRGEPGPTNLPVAWRDRRTILGLCGSRCKRCGTPQYPPQRVCVNPKCKAIDEMENYRFSDKKATLFSYTEDHLAASMSPPQVYGMIDFEGGGRNVFDLTDIEAGSAKVGMPLEMTFRRKYIDEMRGIYGYFWKAMPVR